MLFGPARAGSAAPHGPSARVPRAHPVTGSAAAREAFPPLRVQPIPGRPVADLLRIAHRGRDGAELYRPDDLLVLRDQGANMVELDVSVTRSGRLVVRHDRFSDAVAGLRAAVRRDNVPRQVDLQTVLRGARAAGLGLYLDVKSITESGTRELVRQVTEHELAGRTILASSSRAVHRALRRAGGILPRSALYRSTWTDPLRLADDLGSQFVHPCWEWQRRPDLRLTDEYMGRLAARGIGLVTWHEERREVLAGLCGRGVDGICTDDVALLRSVLRKTR